MYFGAVLEQQSTETIFGVYFVVQSLKDFGLQEIGSLTFLIVCEFVYLTYEF